MVLSWSGHSSGSDAKLVSQDAAAAPSLTPNFTIASTTGKTGSTCEVTTPNQFLVRCTFDASSSTGQIATYQYLLVETNDVLGTTSVITDKPLPKGCSVFNGSVNGQIQVTIRLTITSSSGATANVPKTVTLVKNGVC